MGYKGNGIHHYHDCSPDVQSQPLMSCLKTSSGSTSNQLDLNLVVLLCTNAAVIAVIIPGLTKTMVRVRDLKVCLIIVGSILCDPANPIRSASRIQARIVVFNIDVPLTKGFPVSI